MTNQIPMTVEGKKFLEAELDRLIKIEREQIKNAISEARANGDLSENADYQAAKEKQSHIEGRILEIQGKLAKAQIVDIKKIPVSSRVVFGATVTILDVAHSKSVTYQIVGEDESTTSKDKISYNSPLGRALIGREEGDTAIVKAPKGDVEYEIESVKYL